LDVSRLLFFVPYVVSFAILIFLVAADVAFANVREDRLERLVQRRVPGARRLANLQRSHESLAMAMLILRSSATAVFALLGYSLIVNMIVSRFISIPLGIGAAIVGVILAQAAGRVWGRHNPEQLALTLVPLGVVVQGALEPLTRALLALFRPLVHRFVPRNHAVPAPVNSDALDAAATENGETALLATPEEEEWERQVIRGVLRLESTTVREIMVPRPDIVAIQSGATLEEAVHLVLREGFSRIPVYHETIDNVRGILYAKDLLAALQSGRQTRLEDLVRPVLLVPETKRLADLLREFQSRRVHIALVVDEYGSLVGLVTNEDLLEELVGEIEDEFTVSEPLVERLSPQEAIVDARTSIKYLNEMFGTELEAEGFDTLGGLIYQRLGRIPTAGETVTENGFNMTVLSTAGRRIRRVRVKHALPEREHA
jgi:CBS domain containing-hemolysin-like protein